jgi:hypothetical protein
MAGKLSFCRNYFFGTFFELALTFNLINKKLSQLVIISYILANFAVA